MPIEDLRAVPLLAGIGDESLRLAASGGELEVTAGQVLAQAGDHGSGMFVVLEGTVAVELRGHPVEIGPGGFFGELALLVPDAERIARVRASTDARLLCLPRDTFERLLETEPSFGNVLLREIARRVVGA